MCQMVFILKICSTFNYKNNDKKCYAIFFYQFYSLRQQLPLSQLCQQLVGKVATTRTS